MTETLTQAPDTGLHPAGTELGNALLVGNFIDGSPEWHAARANVAGGSEVANILGYGFKSRYIHWLEKAGLVEREELAPEKDEMFEWGHRMEDPIALKFADRHPEYQLMVGGSWVNKDRAFHGANPDRLLVEWDGVITGALEIKNSKMGRGWENGRVPIKYITQLRWYLDCFGFAAGYIVVLIGGCEYREFRVPADPNQPVVDQLTGASQFYGIGPLRMRREVEAFMASLPTPENPAGTPPPIDGGQDTYEHLRREHMSIVVKGEGSEVELPEEVGTAYLAARQAAQEAETELTRMQGHLLAHMGTAKVAKHKGEIVAARQAKKTAGKDGVPFLVAK